MSIIFSVVGEGLAPPDVAMPFLPHTASIVSQNCRDRCVHATSCRLSEIITPFSPFAADTFAFPCQGRLTIIRSFACSRKLHQNSLFLAGELDVCLQTRHGTKRSRRSPDLITPRPMHNAATTLPKSLPHRKHRYIKQKVARTLHGQLFVLRLCALAVGCRRDAEALFEDA